MCQSFRATGHSCGWRSKDEHISTGPALRAVPIAPCLHESSGGSPCSLERTGHAHSQLPRQLAHTGSVSGSVMRTQGLVLSHLSQLGLRVNWEKSKLLPTQRIPFLGVEFGFGQTDSAPHAGTRSVSVELLEYVQEQNGGTTETVSEAPGAYGGCSGSHTAGAAPYETASTLAPWPSPEVGVAERHAVGPSHSSLKLLQSSYSLPEGTLGTDALALSWPRGLRKYAFPPVSLLAQTLCKVREEEEQILLVAPYWPTRTWFPELMLLVTASPWQIPLRKDLLTQRRGTLWHPRPDLWKLHV